MAKAISDGWHTIKGQSVYVEDGCILRGVRHSVSGLGEETTYPYWYDEKQRVWTNVRRVKVGTFRSGRYAMK